MLIQLSSGQGPAECELAVKKLADSLMNEFEGIEVISDKPGQIKGCYSSILLSSESDLSFLEGSIQWICKSPFRPNHKRKNWFVDVSVIPEMQEINRNKEYKFERFHCGGNGGQNVNKVETGVRLTHIPTGITVTSTSERSQYLNYRNAEHKIEEILTNKEEAHKKKQKKDLWQEHNNLVRGNPVRVYKNMDFKLLSSTNNVL